MTAIFNQLKPADILTFDNVDFVRVSPRTTVTSHPVEFGVQVSDHAQTEPLTISIRGRITETPLLIPKPAAVELALAFLARNERQPMTAVTSRGIFPDMIVTAYDWEINGRKEIVFDLAMRKVRIAFAVSVLIPARLPAPAVEASVASTANAGVQPVVPPPAPPSTSLLRATASLIAASLT